MQGESRLVAAGVEAGVVDVQCRPGDQLVDEHGVLFVELLIASAGGDHQAEHLAPGGQRDDPRDARSAVAEKPRSR